MLSAMLSHLLILSGLSLLICYGVDGQRCHSSEDCNDNQNCNLDLCLPRFRFCVSIRNSSESSCRGSLGFTSKKVILAETEKAKLSIEKKMSILSAATILLRDIHPHRPFHIRFLGVDPVRMLFKFRHELLRNPTDAFGSVTKFHQKMIRIFTVIEDFHSVYIAPQPLRGSLALIPFSVREFFDEGGNRKFIVTDVAIGAKFSNPLFKKGVEIVKWNGLPIQEAVRRLGTDSFGNNPDSKLMFGIRKLTARDLAIEELPRTRNVTFELF